jgi:hypothetical protein
MWIDRLERLPEIGQLVIFSGAKQCPTEFVPTLKEMNRYIQIGVFMGKYWRGGSTKKGKGWYTGLDRVSHWMPYELPELSEESLRVLAEAVYRDSNKDE